MLVPVELISPPLPMDRLANFQDIVGDLQKAGARGTDDSLVYAFSLQFNPELPALDSTTIRNYLQAFVCLQDHLFANASMDTLRKLTRYSEPFAPDYIKLLVQPDYDPGIEQLIDDYLEFNPTRNRALDCLPLFAHIDEQRVRKVVSDDRVKARPTFHYRLPDSNISDPSWTIFEAWRDWLTVEWLAYESERRRELCRLCSDELDNLLGGLGSGWTDKVDQWLAANH